MLFSLIRRFRCRNVVRGPFSFRGSVRMEFTCGRCVLSCLLVFQLFLLRCHRKSRWPRGIVALGTRLFQDLGVCYHYLGCLFRLNNCPFFHAIHATLIKVTSCHFPSNVVFSDLWTCHVTSFDGYKYYVIFVDHFIKYIWYYPLFRKSDVHSTFMKFKNLVEYCFSRSSFYWQRWWISGATLFLVLCWHYSPHYTTAHTRT